MFVRPQFKNTDCAMTYDELNDLCLGSEDWIPARWQPKLRTTFLHWFLSSAIPSNIGHS